MLFPVYIPASEHPLLFTLNVPPLGDMGLVRAGFPSPAADLGAKRVDIAAKLIRHPEATFIWRARGYSMLGCGIDDGDLLVVDRSVTAAHTSVVIAILDAEFVCKKLWRQGSAVLLKSANPDYPDITPSEGQTVEIWGVVTHVIRTLHQH